MPKLSPTATEKLISCSAQKSPGRSLRAGADEVEEPVRGRSNKRIFLPNPIHFNGIHASKLVPA